MYLKAFMPSPLDFGCHLTVTPGVFGRCVGLRTESVSFVCKVSAITPELTLQPS